MSTRLRQTEGRSGATEMTCSDRITKHDIAHMSAWDFHLATINGEFDPSLVPDRWDQMPEPIERSIPRADEARVSFAEWMEFQQLTDDQQTVWLEEKWLRHCERIGAEPPGWWADLPAVTP